MNDYVIKSLENGAVLATVSAHSMLVTDSGIVYFYQNDEAGPGKRVIATTQVSSSTLIVEKKTEKPVVVLPFPTRGLRPLYRPAERAWPEDTGK